MRIQSINDLAATIRGQRQSLGWTQDHLAARAGVSRKWVSEAELGTTVVGLTNLLRVLDVLGLELDAHPVPPDDDVLDHG